MYSNNHAIDENCEVLYKKMHINLVENRFRNFSLYMFRGEEKGERIASFPYIYSSKKSKNNFLLETRSKSNSIKITIYLVENLRNVVKD